MNLSALNSTIKSACDILRRSGSAGALQYVPELSWLLFLRVLDSTEAQESEEAAFVGADYAPTVAAPYRWRDWASESGETYQALLSGKTGAHREWVQTKLLPHLKAAGTAPGATPRQTVVAEVLSGIDRTRVDSDTNFRAVLEKLNAVTHDADNTHLFTLSQVFETLLLKMGEKGNDGGQFFTPREVIRAIVRTAAPRVGETVYDPCCGTGGFLAEARKFMNTPGLGAQDMETLSHRTFYGREKEDLVFPIALANLLLHDIAEPHIWHGNTLTNTATHDGLWKSAPPQFDVILTNPPFGGKEGKEAQTDFAYKSGATEVLFLQHILRSLKTGGRCGLVLSEGALFRTNEEAYVQTKRKLLDECDVWCIVSLPGGVFSAAGAGVKTSLLFWTKGKPTEKIWYYDLSHVKVGKSAPMTMAHFADFFERLPDSTNSEFSWTLDFAERKRLARERAEPFKQAAFKHDATAKRLDAEGKALKCTRPDEAKRLTQEATEEAKQARAAKNEADTIEAGVYDLKAVNPHAAQSAPDPTPDELLAQIAVHGATATNALHRLRDLIATKP